MREKGVVARSSTMTKSQDVSPPSIHPCSYLRPPALTRTHSRLGPIRDVPLPLFSFEPSALSSPGRRDLLLAHINRDPFWPFPASVCAAGRWRGTVGEWVGGALVSGRAFAPDVAVVAVGGDGESNRDRGKVNVEPEMMSNVSAWKRR